VEWFAMPERASSWHTVTLTLGLQQLLGTNHWLPFCTSVHIKRCWQSWKWVTG